MSGKARVLEVVQGSEGWSLSVGDGSTGKRIIGRKPYGGGRTAYTWKLSAEKIDGMVAELLSAKEEIKKEIEMGNRDFGWALDQLRQQATLCRRGWDDKGMWIKLQVPGVGSKMSLPYIYMRTTDGHLVLWLASQTDILADDWEIVDILGDL